MGFLSTRPHRPEAQDVALSRPKRGFESRWGRDLMWYDALGRLTASSTLAAKTQARSSSGVAEREVPVPGRVPSLGARVELDGHPATSVGILPATFSLPKGAQLWTAK